MNQDEIIDMARQAGLSNPLWIENDYAIIEAFAKLVAAKEREACAEMCDTYEDWSGPWGQYDNLYAAIESANEIAKAIRARGQA
jgi:hypothetical protein